MIDYDVILNEARQKISTLNLNTQFSLKDLFLGVQWESFSGGERRELGRRFKYAVNKGEVPNTRWFDKAQNGTNMYIKN